MDPDEDPVKNIFNWYRDETSGMALNMPFEGGSNSTWTRDYSNFGNDGNVINVVWNATAGYDSFGAYKFRGECACIVIIDDETIDNDISSIEQAANNHNVDSSWLVNDDNPVEYGNPWLRWNTNYPGDQVLLPSGETGDEGLFALPENTPWSVEDFINGVVPQDELDKISNVTPLHDQELVQLVGKTCIAVVYNSDVSMNYDPDYANLQGARYGLFAFTVLDVIPPGTLPESGSSTSLYDVQILVESPINLTDTCFDVTVYDDIYEDSFIEIPYDESLDITDELTISAWVKLDDLGEVDKEYAIVSHHDYLNETGYYLYYKHDFSLGPTFQFRVYDEDGAQHAKTTPSEINLSAGTWYHVAGTYDKSTVKVYVNGIEGDISTPTEYPLKETNKPLRIGMAAYDSLFELNGHIDDITIWKKSLSVEEINALYNERADMIVSQETSVGDIWRCAVTPNDGYQDGETLNSNEVQIVAIGSPWWSEIIPYQNIAEDGYKEIDLIPYASDNETASEDLIFYIVDENASEVNCWVDNDDNKNLSMLPAENWYGIASCSIIISDGEKNSSVTTVYINVTPVNDAPVINLIGTNPIYVVMNASFNCFANVTDVEGEISWVNFTIYYPDGSKAIDNVKGIRDGDIWTSPNVNPISGTWNCSIIASDGIDVSKNSISISLDLDNDGYTFPDDCDDNNASINPGVTEILNNYADDDCDRYFDEGGDYDNDGILNEDDNCPHIYNPDQTDTNNNGVGDACNDTHIVINQREINSSEFLEMLSNNSALAKAFDYAKELGYTQIYAAREMELGGRINVTGAVLYSEDYEVIFLLNPNQDYFDKNGSYCSCALENGTICSDGKNYNASSGIAFLIKVEGDGKNINNYTIFSREWGVVISSNGTLINYWENSSCSYARCIASCIPAILGFPPQDIIDTVSSLYGIVCGYICGTCLIPEPASLVECSACLLCAVGLVGGCGIECIDSCKYGHVCYPESIKENSFSCNGDTLTYDVCDDDGLGYHPESRFCSYGCANNQCNLEPSCSGWTCKDPFHSGWQNGDCSWSNIVYCEFGCNEINGKCKPQGPCNSQSPNYCNGVCYDCPVGFTLCCPSSGPPLFCCGSGTYCMSDGSCAASCEPGFKCKDSAHLAYQYYDCSWSSSETCPNGCITDGNGVGRCQEDVCEAGWKCKDSMRKGYQDSDCSWSSVSYCEHGCSNGACRTQIGLKTSCTFDMEAGSECDDTGCNLWEFDETDEADVYKRLDWALAKFDLDHCYSGMRKDDVLYARLDFWIADTGEDISDTDLRVYKGCEDDNVGGLSNYDEDCMINIGSDIYRPNNYPHLVESVHNEENPCGGNDLECGVDVTDAIYKHTDWDDPDEIVFVWYPENDQRKWYLNHQPYNPKLYLEYPMTCSIDSDCGTDHPVGSKYCSNNDVYQNHKIYSCSNQNCYSATSAVKYQECGQTSYGTWGNNYCVGNQVKHDRTKYVRGCSSGKCTSSTSTESEIVEICAYACFEGQCVGGPSDLIVKYFLKQAPPDPIYVGDEIVLVFRIENIGNSSTQNINWRLDWGDTYSTTGVISQLDVGQGQIIARKHNYTTSGVYYPAVIVDPYDTIAEQNESNNEKVMTLNILPSPLNIILNEPTNGSIISTMPVTFNFLVEYREPVNITNCLLWDNFSGNWERNQTIPSTTPLKILDLTNIDISGLTNQTPGVNAYSIEVNGTSELKGYINVSDGSYIDGLETSTEPAHITFKINTGIDIREGDYIILYYDGKNKKIYLPEIKE